MQKDEIILASDDNGNFTGEYLPKMAGHTGRGRRHFAITVFIFNSKGEVLLQKRKHRIFDNIWDNTASTHQLHHPDGRDETDEEATDRALKREYGIEKINLTNLGGFNYFSTYGKYCENEHCILMIGTYDGLVKLNHQVAYDYKWMNKVEFLTDIEHHPDNYTPWAVKATKILKSKGLFNSPGTSL